MTVQEVEKYFYDHNPYPGIGEQGVEKLQWLIERVKELEEAINRRELWI